jgi:hypothetical protein
MLTSLLKLFTNKYMRIRQNGPLKASKSDASFKERRLSALFPVEPGSTHESIVCHELDQRRLFLSLASSQCSCLIELTSQRRLLRAAVLMVDGKFIGAVYGRRMLPNKIYGRDAYLEFLTELAHGDAKISVRWLSNKLALSMAVLFKGPLVGETFTPTELFGFNQVLSRTKREKLFGLAFVCDAEGVARTALYFGDGDILDTYSFDTGARIEHFSDAVKIPARGFLRLMVSPLEAIEENGGVVWRTRDVEHNQVKIGVRDQDPAIASQHLRQHSSKSGIVAALMKNRGSHADEHTRATRAVQDMAIRPALSQHHSHLVNPIH